MIKLIDHQVAQFFMRLLNYGTRLFLPNFLNRMKFLINPSESDINLGIILSQVS